MTTFETIKFIHDQLLTKVYLLGGTLGMCIGFSFGGYVSALIQFIQKKLFPDQKSNTLPLFRNQMLTRKNMNKVNLLKPISYNPKIKMHRVEKNNLKPLNFKTRST